jgi:diacylglycerol kinase (ATP)
VTNAVVFNPAAGRGRAARWLDELKDRLPAGTVLLPTERVGHGIELARDAAAQYDRVIAAGGDGTVHEVANGLLLANRPEVRFAVVPVGSANDYAFSLGVDRWWRDRRPWGELVTKTVDAGIVRGGGRERFFVNGCGIGFNGLVSNEARGIRWLRGIPLYTLAVVRTLIRRFAAPALGIAFDGDAIERPTLVQSFAIGQREGGFPLALAAKLDDGLFDCLHVGDIRRWELIRHLPSMITGNLPRNHPKVSFRQCRRATVRGAGDLCVHVDGEMFCLPGDGVRELEIELLPGRLSVETWVLVRAPSDGN